jgi:hypothetical protein
MPVMKSNGEINPISIKKVTDKESNISNEVVEEKPKRKYSKKASTRGGAREGSGRPKGSTNKISPEELISDFHAQAGMSFEQFVNSRILLASVDGNQELVSRYILGLAKYFIKDVQELDVTSNGQTLGASFSFPTLELPEWNNDPTKH